jgi:hypothetical protein
MHMSLAETELLYHMLHLNMEAQNSTQSMYYVCTTVNTVHLNTAQKSTQSMYYSNYVESNMPQNPMNKIELDKTTQST